MSKQRQSKFIMIGDYDERQIKALIPNFILTQENQIQQSKVRHSNDFIINKTTIIKNEKLEFEVDVYWTEK
jgi:hypothetical protein